MADQRGVASKKLGCFLMFCFVARLIFAAEPVQNSY